MCLNFNLFNLCLSSSTRTVATSVQVAQVADSQTNSETKPNQPISLLVNYKTNTNTFETKPIESRQQKEDKSCLLSKSSSQSSLSSLSCTSSVTTLHSLNNKMDFSPRINIPANRPSGFSSLNFSNNNSQLELKIDKLNAKQQSYVFNSERLVAKPIVLHTEEDTKLSSILDEELSNQNRLVKSHTNHRSHRNKSGKITISQEQVYDFNESDIIDLGQIGNGEFGTVLKVLHKPSGTFMAMKKIGPTVGSQCERKKVLKELSFVLECNDYDYVVKFYGVKFNNEPADCLILMELMDTSLEKFYKFVYEVRKEEIPESILGKIAVATVNALNYLKERHKIIHRDVKPSNILINRYGAIKMCDFGISGKLVDSIAASRDAGCQFYMAPERIDPVRACENGYDVRSDVWSLGITLFELSTGKFPYPQWKTIFHQLNLVVDSDAPRLEAARLSNDFKDFVNTCLTKDENKRPKYNVLLQHPLILAHVNSAVNVSAYVEPYINQMQSISK